MKHSKEALQLDKILTPYLKRMIALFNDVRLRKVTAHQLEEEGSAIESEYLTAIGDYIDTIKRSDQNNFDTSKVTRVEVINHTDKGESGRAFTYWSEYDNGVKDPNVSLHLQDDGKTLKVFIE